MRLLSIRFAWLAIAALWCADAVADKCYGQFRVGGVMQANTAYDATLRRGLNAGFNRPYADGAYGGFYPGYGESPIGGYMRGYADVISSVTQGMIDEQQSRMMAEQIKQVKVDTRRKQFDEWLYERNAMPTVEDDRERRRIEDIRRARNNPPSHEIWSGQALNELLTAIQQQDARNVRGPTVQVSPETVSHINVNASGSTGTIGLLRDGGKLTWPAVLQRPAFEDQRKQIDSLARKAYQQAQAGPAPGDVIDGMTEAVNKLNDTIGAQIHSLTPTDYSRAKSYVREIESTIKMLQDPNVGNYLSKKWAVKGGTVGEVVDNMTSQGLRFAPATHGDEPAYNTMYRGMVAYLQWDQSRPWDMATK